MRINKFLAENGVASRRHADKMIEEGRIKINDIIAQLGSTVEDGDVVTVDNQPIAAAEKKEVYYIMNKPKGYLTTVSDNRGRKTVMELLPRDIPRVYPVGRLDYETEGLLILTNDGELAYRLMHPKNEIPKTYLVRVEGTMTEKDLNPLRSGIELDGSLTKKCKTHIVETHKLYTKVHITITEGKNRQVRRMFEAIGRTVDFLKRIKIGNLSLSGLDRGEVRELTEEEVLYLKNL